ncbi:transcriptional regulator with XRE-family HTH domain [Rhizobium skierniewicense]|uniref:Transcriptional regulator with XRE-family HTH domain n=1 Tax=Rhizobium skierniewicense TaxID=984260 RepID=A0A7W6CFG1_9HYPH|nr:helix-turn-helix transcriptional regulator [Rhizobium skierniewicense]MBB3948449.1 transcriptional regulator with XRE-family HTH domain [Rhizobium skierniewicense]
MKNNEKRLPQAADIEVGRRIRVRRKALGMSQTSLGETVGVTFQQIQKYENAKNRVGAGRLSKIAAALDVPVSYFFDQENDPAEINETNVAPHTVATFVTSAEGRLLNQAFDRIDDLAVRKKIAAMVVAIADGEPNPSE